MPLRTEWLSLYRGANKNRPFSPNHPPLATMFKWRQPTVVEIEEKVVDQGGQRGALGPEPAVTTALGLQRPSNRATNFRISRPQYCHITYTDTQTIMLFCIRGQHEERAYQLLYLMCVWAREKGPSAALPPREREPWRLRSHRLLLLLDRNSNRKE